MPYWRDEIFNQLNGIHSGSSLSTVAHESHGRAFVAWHSDGRLAKLTWPEWIAMRESQSQLGRLPRMKVTNEYKPKPLLPLLEVDEAGNVLLKPNGQLMTAQGR